MSSLTNKYTAAAVALVLSLCSASCLKYEKKDKSPTSGTATMVCDNSFENIMAQEVDVFEYQYPDAHILVRYGTQAEALDSLFNLNTRTVVISRDLTPEEKRALKAKYKNERKLNVTVRSSKIAVDAIAFIVNPKNTCEKLTVSELADIMTGESTEWNDLEPSNSAKSVLYSTNRVHRLPHISPIRSVQDILLPRPFRQPALFPTYSRLSRSTLMPLAYSA